MKIRAEDYQEVLDHLTKKRWEGDEFVAYCDNNLPVDKVHMYTFSTAQEAGEFCYEMATDVDFFNFIAIRSAYRAMTDGKNNIDKLLQKDGTVDIGEMVTQYYSDLEQKQIIDNVKSKTMNMANLEYLQEQVKKTGFGDQLTDKIANAISGAPEDFKLGFQTKFGNDEVNAELSFSKSKSTDMYFFNSYKAEVQREGNDEKVSQTFFINGFENRHNNIYLKEAYNLLCGRSVNKDLINREGEMYNSWLQLDFTQTNEHGNFKTKYYNEKYGYDLEDALGKHQIKELSNDEHKANLLKSLKKGNLQSATFQKDGQEIKKFIEASPQFKSINVYDSNMKREGQRLAKGEKEGQENSQSQKRSERQENVHDEAPEIPEQKSRKRNARQSR